MDEFLEGGVGRAMKPPKNKSDGKKRTREKSDGLKERTKPRLTAEPQVRLRKKRQPTDTHKNPVKANKYAQLEEFGGKEPFVVLKEEGGLLKCVPCGSKIINFKRKADSGARGASEAGGGAAQHRLQRHSGGVVDVVAAHCGRRAHLV